MCLKRGDLVKATFALSADTEGTYIKELSFLSSVFNLSLVVGSRHANVQFTIDENPNDVIVVFMHTPVVPPVDFIWHPCKNEDEVANLLSNYSQPILVLAGHYHATKIIQQDNVIHVSSPSLRYAQEFRVISIKNYPDKTVFNFDYKETRLKNLITYPKKRYAGTKEDKYRRITIYKNEQR